MSGTLLSMFCREVTLRKIVDSDLPVFFEHQCDPEACRMAAFASRDREAFMAHWAKILIDETVIARAVVVDGQLAGNVVGFHAGGYRLLGYWIGCEFWGRGVATKAVRHFLEVETTRPLHARVAVHNIGSICVLEKCGFTFEAKEETCGVAGDPIGEYLMVRRCDPRFDQWRPCP